MPCMTTFKKHDPIILFQNKLIFNYVYGCISNFQLKNDFKETLSGNIS